MSRKRSVHQLVVGASPGDAIYDQSLIIQKALQAWGYEAGIYACHLHPSLVGQVPHFSRCRPRRGDVVLWHYSIGSELSAFIRRLKCPVIMTYHNVTPPEYLQGVSNEMAQLVREGRADLSAYRENVHVALADSEYSRLELEAAGYSHTGVLPIVLEEAKYDKAASNPALIAQYGDGAANLLFVGRIAPNKCQDDVIRVFYHYHHIQPHSRLLLVGQAWEPAEQYHTYLKGLVNHLGLSDHVHLTGHVSFDDMVTYYRLADVLVCMSEHEGFGKPLIESMYLDVPVVAYAATAVPYTLGDAGVLVHRKDYEVIAELINLIASDRELCGRLLAGQRARRQAFGEKHMLRMLRGHLDKVLQ